MDKRLNNNLPQEKELQSVGLNVNKQVSWNSHTFNDLEFCYLKEKRYSLLTSRKNVTVSWILCNVASPKNEDLHNKQLQRKKKVSWVNNNNKLKADHAQPDQVSTESIHRLCILDNTVVL